MSFLGVVALYILIGVFVFFAVVGVVFAVAWLGCKPHDLIF